jgi:tetratricopeptide (TPR) repeat protein
MSEFQLILSIIALTIFVIFFKQLFSGNHPQRGVDFEAKLPQDSIGGISRVDKTFKKNTPQEHNRVQELMNIAQSSLEKKDNIEAKKALTSLLILEPKNIDALRMLATTYLNMNNYSDAKKTLLELLELNSSDDLAHNLLANTLHKLGEDQEAIKHHELAIKLDNSYAPYYYNYANTLYDLGEFNKALELYKKALNLDPNLTEAKKMKEKLENATN